MCLAIPMQITEITCDELVQCRAGESTTFMTVSTALIDEELQIGDYIIIHAGFALRKMEKKDAEETLTLFREIAQADHLSQLL